MGVRGRYLFTSESVSEGHPDKMADQISDAVLDAVMKDDPTGRVSVANAFGSLLNDAVLLETGRRLNMWIESPSPALQAMGIAPPCESCVRLRLRVVRGRVIRP